jgi:hypothetical protein
MTRSLVGATIKPETPIQQVTCYKKEKKSKLEMSYPHHPARIIMVTQGGGRKKRDIQPLGSFSWKLGSLPRCRLLKMEARLAGSLTGCSLDRSCTLREKTKPVVLSLREAWPDQGEAACSRTHS